MTVGVATWSSTECVVTFIRSRYCSVNIHFSFCLEVGGESLWFKCSIDFVFSRFDSFLKLCLLVVRYEDNYDVSLFLLFLIIESCKGEGVNVWEILDGFLNRVKGLGGIFKWFTEASSNLTGGKLRSFLFCFLNLAVRIFNVKNVLQLFTEIIVQFPHVEITIKRICSVSEDYDDIIKYFFWHYCSDFTQDVLETSTHMRLATINDKTDTIDVVLILKSINDLLDILLVLF